MDANKTYTARELEQFRPKKQPEGMLFVKCGSCGAAIPKEATFEVFKRHYDGECMDNN